MSSGLKEISNTVRNYIRETFLDAQDEPLGDEDVLLGGNIVDSMGILKLIVFAETKFAITLEDEDIIPDNFKTIGSFSQLIKIKLQNDQAQQVG